jgi:hypothetical protein
VVTVNGKKITNWTFDASDRNGVITINSGQWNVNEKVVVFGFDKEHFIKIIKCFVLIPIINLIRKNRMLKTVSRY